MTSEVQASREMQALAMNTEVTLFGFEGAESTEVGVDCNEGPPVPIPNTEVKLIYAEDTCLETGRKNR